MAIACAKQAEQVDKKVRLKQASKMTSQRQKSEAETRYMIDEQLRQVGWEQIRRKSVTQKVQDLRKVVTWRLLNGQQIPLSAKKAKQIMRCLWEQNLSVLLRRKLNIRIFHL